MTNMMKRLGERYREALQRHRNLPFLKATMSAAALVAMSNGHVSFAQRVRTDQVLETLDELKVFDPHEGVELFNDIVTHIKASPKEGRALAIHNIDAAARDEDSKRMILRICMAISEVGGQIPRVEQIEIVSLCSHLGLDPKGCGLYVDELPPEKTPAPHQDDLGQA